MPYKTQDRIPASKRTNAVKPQPHVPIKMPEPVKIPVPETTKG